MTSRRRAALSGAVVVLLVIVGGLLWRCQADQPYVAPPPEQRSAAADSATASDTLLALQEALQAGDAAAASALGAGRAGGLLAAVATNVRELRLTDLSLRYLSETGASSGENAWAAQVEVTWRFRGYDGDTASRGEVEFGFADAGAAIASVGGPSGLTPLWLQGPVTSRASSDALVLTTGPAGRLPAYLRQARRAIDNAHRILGGRPRLVVEVPSSAAALDRAAGVDAGTYQAIAAVTTSADGSLVRGTPLHVFLNPEVYAGLGPLAAQVVMSHETAHVVTAAPYAEKVPLWLLEGFADYVALRDVDLSITRSAGQVIAQVRKEGVPPGLPGRSEFDGKAAHLGATYEAAWLACVTLAERGGEDELIGLYRALSEGGDLATELRERFGWSEAQLTAAWQQRLRTLAG